MNDEPPKPNRPGPERKVPSLGGNVIWYLLALGASTLFLVSLMDTGSQVELSYMDLVKLIEKGAPTSNPKAAIEVHEGSDGQGAKVVRYSNLDNLKIGPHEITGTVTRQVISPEAERSRRAEDDVAFPHRAVGLENDNNFLFNLLKKQGIRQCQRARRRPAAGRASCRCSC